MKRWNPDDKIYTCCICGNEKNDDESRFSFDSEERKFCWECHELMDMKIKREKLMRNIEKEIREIGELSARIRQIEIKNPKKEEKKKHTLESERKTEENNDINKL